LALSRQGVLKPFAILRSQTMPFQNCVQGDFCNIVGGAVTRLIGALLLEQNDEWAVQRARYMTLETIAPLGDDLTDSLPSLVA
jgi:surface antigen